jgi:Flp pilus assembly protein TadD
VLLILSPTLVVPIVKEVAAERRMYLQLATLVAIVVVYAFVALQLWRRRNGTSRSDVTISKRILIVAGAAAATLSVIYAIVDINRLADYRDPLVFWQKAEENQPGDPMIENNFGYALVCSGKLAEATAHFRQAVQLKPSFADARNNLGLALLQAGRPVEAIAEFQHAVELEPTHSNAHYNLGLALMSTDDSQGAIDQFQLTLQITPNFPEADFNLGILLAAEKRFTEAITAFQHLLTLRPNDADAYYNLAQIYAQLHHDGDAATAAHKALELARNQQRADLIDKIRNWLATFHAQENQHDDAESGAGHRQR